MTVAADGGIGDPADAVRPDAAWMLLSEARTSAARASAFQLLDRLGRRVADRGDLRMFWLGEIGGGRGPLAAAAVVFSPNRDEAEILAAGVAPEIADSGVERRLFRLLLDALRARGTQTVAVPVRPDAGIPEPLLRLHGFQEGAGSSNRRVYRLAL